MIHARLVFAATLLALLGFGASPGRGEEAQSHTEAITEYRAQRIERLQSDTGWLTVAGFAWLEPGENAFGSGEDAVIRLPADVAPATAGVLYLDAETGEITVRVQPGVSLEIEKVLVREKVLSRDENGSSPKMTLGRVTFWVMERGGEAAVRMQDPECYLRAEFVGIDFYGIDPAYRVEGRVDSEEPFTQIAVPNFMGYTDVSVTRPVHFTLNGEEHTLFPTLDDESDSTFFFVFADETTGRETYGGGRFFYADLEPDGTVEIDFNKAYNPPCALNPFTTCPLPPEGNTLPVAIRAGEKAYPGGGAQE